ncbi:unnamed protein product [Vitrella brassicaformis CCMP3155]|uniref:Uncharacterized protein n=1 Tax=Vitrella brassicaformis (strain CCMP3155) TaxID=1169540 RepID=A0A0G4FXL0_VITBC|nr:unnamed protein product [Vitrella brassicaformis CCMP3155]|eukprot:CEM20051.1 unnamed protein product [Vitrella brassicaformis CCMP3155]
MASPMVPGRLLGHITPPTASKVTTSEDKGGSDSNSDSQSKKGSLELFLEAAGRMREYIFPRGSLLVRPNAGFDRKMRPFLLTQSCGRSKVEFADITSEFYRHLDDLEYAIPISVVESCQYEGRTFPLVFCYTVTRFEEVGKQHKLEWAMQFNPGTRMRGHVYYINKLGMHNFHLICIVMPDLYWQLLTAHKTGKELIDSTRDVTTGRKDMSDYGMKEQLALAYRQQVVADALTRLHRLTDGFNPSHYHPSKRFPSFLVPAPSSNVDLLTVGPIFLFALSVTHNDLLETMRRLERAIEEQMIAANKGLVFYSPFFAPYLSQESARYAVKRYVVGVQLEPYDFAWMITCHEDRDINSKMKAEFGAEWRRFYALKEWGDQHRKKDRQTAEVMLSQKDRSYVLGTVDLCMYVACCLP